jgi:PhzF family phenazine biosynthesis protein
MRRFQQVDVFGAEPFRGNPVAVVVDGEDLSTDQMQTITRWMNLSETTFLLPPTAPGADYRVRIFTLAEELPFAGHPTLGSCHAWLAFGGEPQQPGIVVQECGVGLVTLRRDDNGLAFAAPPLVRSGPVDERRVERLAGALGLVRAEIIAAEWVDNGPGWLALLLRDADRVLAVQPPPAPPPGETRFDVGLVGPYPDGAPCAFEVRAFLADDRGAVIEDPVTGSLNASLGQWLLGSGRARAPYVASQGTRLGRKGRVRVDQDAEAAVWVGGDTVTLVNGQLDA